MKVHFFFFFYALLGYVIAVDFSKAYTCEERGGVCLPWNNGSRCPKPDLLCHKGSCCQVKKSKAKMKNSPKRRCTKTKRSCRNENGVCQALSQCPTSAVKNLCKSGSCYCCLGDVPSCLRGTDCANRGGFCVRKTEYCTKGTILQNGCSGSNCFCCVPDSACKCSQAPAKKGRKASSVSYPWLAGIKVPRVKGIHCSGVIINNLYILTAAHCLFDKKTYESYPAKKIKVTLTGLSSSTVKVAEIIFHDDFCIFEGQNNIALLRLKYSLDFTSGGVTPVCLPTREDQFYSGAFGSVLGWTASKTKNNPSQVLKVIPKETLNSGCNGRQRVKHREITDDHICAHPSKGTDGCLSTSGSPLTTSDGRGTILIGIFSFSEGCGARNASVAPTVYTRVTQYLSWITENTRGALYCAQ